MLAQLSGRALARSSARGCRLEEVPPPRNPDDSAAAWGTYLEQFDVHCTDHESNEFGIQWMRYGPRCKLPELVKTVAHVAFEVDDLAAEMAGREVLVAPNSPSPGVVVAFILESGAPVELLQYLVGTGGAQSKGRGPRLAG